MTGLRHTLLNSVRGCANLSSNSRRLQSYKCHVRTNGVKEPKPVGNVGSTINVGCYSSRPNNCSFLLTPSHSLFARGLSPRYYSFFSSSGNEGKSAEQGIQSSSTQSGSELNFPNSDELVGRAKDLWHSASEKAKEASAEISPHVESLLESHPYLKDVVVPVSLTFTGTLLAWFVMPRLLRRFHKYGSQGQAALLSGKLAIEAAPYEKSFWGALEDPLRYLATFMAFTQIGMMVAPTTIASQYLTPAWRGAVILSFVWFLQRWKTNLFARALVAPTVAGVEREKLLTLDKISSVGLFVIGVMAFAEACGVAVQSILTVGGIGGVATAFAARDILGNVLSGLSMQFSRPFSIGDTIKAGSIEGQVVDMGLTTTSLLNAEKFPVIVPNSLFSSQVIVNKSRAEWRAVINKIPVQMNDLDKIPQIASEINEMLKLHAKVFLGKEAPYCFLSRIESSFAELTIGCNLKRMKKEEFYLTEQDILLQSVQIIKKHGAKLGSTYQESFAQ